MPALSNNTLRTVFLVAAVALVVFLFVGGNMILGIAALVLIVAMGGGAMLYRKAGPPER
jgi:hypothetical protein